MKKIYCSSMMISIINNSFGSTLSGKGDILDILKDKLKKLKIEQNNINKNINNYGKINNDVTALKQIKDNNNNEKVVKIESVVDVTEYFKALNDYLGKEYKDKKTFNDGFDELCNNFTDDFKDKVDFDYSKCEKYLVIEGTVKVPNDATLDKLKEEYYCDEFEKRMFNIITNCINNGNKFYVYFDNLNEDLKYGDGFKPRNKKAIKEIELNEVSEDMVAKHKGKDLIILYVFNSKTAHVFFTEQ